MPFPGKSRRGGERHPANGIRLRPLQRRVAALVAASAGYAALCAAAKGIRFPGAGAAAGRPATGRVPLGIFNQNDTSDVNCTDPAILDFPPDLFSEGQRAHGAVALHVFLAFYLFALIAVVCDNYFVPSIEKITQLLHVSKDVAGATFMAAATSSPELFINSVGTFVTEGDLGVGTIVGSAVFNILAVPACCGLFAGNRLKMDWWPLTRDSIAYGVSVALLILTLADGKVSWQEAFILVACYAIYILRGHMEVESQTGCDDLDSSGQDGKDEDLDLWHWPSHSGIVVQGWWLLTWPISLLLYLTVPDCRLSHNRQLYPITFTVCILYIGSASYLVAWMITVIGDTARVPDSVMGLTFLAAGTSLPEAVSSVIVTNQGYGSMGLSSSLGSNTFDILLCLGLPWLIKSTIVPGKSGQHYVLINSKAIQYSAALLLSALMILYILFACNKFKLDQKTGFLCLLAYFILLIVATLNELNFYQVINLPTCGW